MTRSVDAYELLNGTFYDYLDDYLLGLISPDVYSFNADGFFTDKVIGTGVTTTGATLPTITTTSYTSVAGGIYYIGGTPYGFQDLVYVAGATIGTKYSFVENNNTLTVEVVRDANGNVTSVTEVDANGNRTTRAITTLNEAATLAGAVTNPPTSISAVAALPLNTKSVYGGWIDGYRTVDNNFNGVILGGKAAVSKDVAKRLDDTVKDSIYKINDPISSYWDSDSYITIGNRTYYTLGWLNKNTTSWWNNLGVQGLTAETAIAVPYGSFGYRYFYQPYDFTQGNVTYFQNTGKINTQSYTIKFGRFDSQAAFAKVSDNSYTGYGLTGDAELTITYTYDANGNTTNVTAFWAEVNL
jgi:hypothetical protein